MVLDIEPYVINTVTTRLESDFSGILVSGEFIRQPSSFPFVAIVEEDNYMTQIHMDSSDTEKFTTVVYEVNVFSDKPNGKRRQCREIMKAIDEEMYKMNFRKLSSYPSPNIENASIYRLTARYRAETDGKYIYRR